MQGYYSKILRTEHSLGISVSISISISVSGVGGERVAKPSFGRGNGRRRRVTRRAGISMEVGGLDSEGRKFNNAGEMWTEQVGDPNKKTDWYRQGVGYWEGVKASVDGVLGGYGHVDKADIVGSEVFLNTLLSERFTNAAAGSSNQHHLVALDCGSGIGRVTKNLLIRFFNEVDLLEPVSHFLETARESLAPEKLMASDMHKATNFFCVPLQEFTPDAGRYDVIWVQWCIGHLTDDDFVSFFKRAKVGLKPGGIFVLKENIARSGFVLDNVDRSITRSDSYFKDLFRQCGLHLYKSKDQKGFPEELFAVKMYALTTDLPKRVHNTRSKGHRNRPGIIK
ncbi:alpha N-terminal protein methyltransferase 1 isoform X1 [Ziziphus jujuba]|uniref:Alpha N-terminal protein methyltransferase 1 n=1 Tax=Ziziphus jujuba TaxID=326968 RepID=A0A9B4DXJ7_ZIZJJ|nr:alpha N-terminal protein methyltransferase 1 isoform X1 [Ziziphus jujuba]